MSVTSHLRSFLLTGDPFNNTSYPLFCSDPKLSRRLAKPLVGAITRLISISSTRFLYQLNVIARRLLNKAISVPISSSFCLSGFTFSFASTVLELRAVLLKNELEVYELNLE